MKDLSNKTLRHEVENILLKSGKVGLGTYVVADGKGLVDKLVELFTQFANEVLDSVEENEWSPVRLIPSPYDKMRARIQELLEGK